MTFGNSATPSTVTNCSEAMTWELGRHWALSYQWWGARFTSSVCILAGISHPLRFPFRKGYCGIRGKVAWADVGFGKMMKDCPLSVSPFMYLSPIPMPSKEFLLILQNPALVTFPVVFTCVCFLLPFLNMILTQLLR